LNVTNTAQDGGLTDDLCSQAYSAALCKLIAKNKKIILFMKLQSL